MCVRLCIEGRRFQSPAYLLAPVPRLGKQHGISVRSCWVCGCSISLFGTIFDHLSSHSSISGRVGASESGRTGPTVADACFSHTYTCNQPRSGIFALVFVSVVNVLKLAPSCAFGASDESFRMVRLLTSVFVHVLNK